MVAIPQPENTTTRSIYETIERVRNEPPRPHLGASVLGHPCRRALWYGFRWATHTKHPGRVLRLFRRGQLEEEQFTSDLQAAGVTVHEADGDGNQFRFSDIGGHVGGSMDGAAVGLLEAPKTWHVLEYKTHGDTSFRDLEKHGVKKSKPEHYAQMQLYMHWSGMKRAYYLAVNKNDDHLHGERVRYCEVDATKLVSHARAIVTADEPLERISEKPEFYLCKWCDHSAVCHEKQLPPANCRTCLHASPELDGDARWSCAKHRVDLTVNEQRAGCASHAYIPALVPWKQTDANSAENWVEYQYDADRRLRNGTRPTITGEVPTFASSEIHIAQEGESINVLFDPIITGLRKVFGGTVVASDGPATPPAPFNQLCGDCMNFSVPKKRCDYYDKPVEPNLHAAECSQWIDSIPF